METDSVKVQVLRETDKAYQFRDSEDSSRIAWFPKSYVSFTRRNVKTGEAVAEIPLWLLTKNDWNK